MTPQVVPELGKRLRRAMDAADVSPTDLTGRLVRYRGDDPDDRRAWEAAKRAVARWRNGPSRTIESDAERAFVEAELELQPGDLLIAQEVDAELSELVHQMEERLARLEADVAALLDGRVAGSSPPAARRGASSR